MTDDLNDHPVGTGSAPPGALPPSTRAQEASGRTVDEAIEQGLASLGVGRTQVEIEILDEGSRGILGLGGRGARVRLTLRSGWGATAGAVANEILSFMSISADVTAVEGPESIRVNLQGTDVGPLIGKHGQTLGAFETLLALLVGRKAGAPVRVELDAEGYRERRQASLEDLARRTADRAARHGREIALTPMGPRDRRIIHVTLQDHPRVSTISRGERDMRRVVIVPKDVERGEGDSEEEGQPGGFSGRPRVAEASSESPPEGSQGRQGGRFGRSSGSSGPRSSRRRTSPEQGRRLSRPGATGSFGRRSQLPGPQPPKGARPDGLPSDEELEAEIEAYLARTRPESPKDAPSSTGTGEDPESSGQDGSPKGEE